ncbi:MAG: site-2 protease family protein [Christensenellaceae bacterium]|jgi:Zn-dependent protease|nr:site-2 protease family protein [Christensenellaceae bacterium]
MLFGLVQSDLSFEFNIVLLLVFALSLLTGIIPHEVAHGFAALKQGDPSAKIAGRLSLNPAKHIDPMGLAAFVFIGIGWAKPVPVNPFNYKNFRRGNFIVSIAGIITNLVIGFSSSLFLYIVYRFGNVDSLGIFALFYFFFFCTVINISLMLFNLLPICPLDGYNILVSFTKPTNRYMQFMRQNSHWVLLSVMIFLMLADFMGYGVIGVVRDGIIDGFLSFWGLMF